MHTNFQSTDLKDLHKKTVQDVSFLIMQYNIQLKNKLQEYGLDLVFGSLETSGKKDVLPFYIIEKCGFKILLKIHKKLSVSDSDYLFFLPIISLEDIEESLQHLSQEFWWDRLNDTERFKLSHLSDDLSKKTKGNNNA